MTLHIDVTLDYRFDAPTDCLLQISAAPMADQRILSELLDLGGLVTRTNRAEDEVGTRLWCRPDERLSCRYRADVEILRTTSDIATLSGHAPAELPEDIVKYLLPSRYCPSDKFLAFVAQEFGRLLGRREDRRDAGFRLRERRLHSGRLDVRDLGARDLRAAAGRLP